MLVLAITQAPLGSILFFSCTAVPCVVYGLLLRRLMGGARLDGSRRLLLAALLLAVAFRVPLAAGWVGPRSDMVRYRWDGRVQTLGINPFLVVPDQPAVAWTHTDETRLMPSVHDRTPYPAAAQLFFRGIVSIADSSRLMKAALVVCDLLTMVVLLAWLRDTRRSPWLVLVYAWNPLVILEIAHSGHIDALGSLWIAVSAWMLSTNRGMRAAIAFVIAVAVKLLPIVLIPLYWKRMRVRDGVVAALVLAVLYLPFASAGTLPLGAVPNVIEYVRFNGPAFKHLALLMSPKVAATDRGTGGSGRRGVDAATLRGRRARSVGVADGRRARRRAGRVSLVPPLLHSVSFHAPRSAAGRLDDQRAPGLHRVGTGVPPRTPMASAGSRHVDRVRGGADGADRAGCAQGC